MKLLYSIVVAIVFFTANFAFGQSCYATCQISYNQPYPYSVNRSVASSSLFGLTAECNEYCSKSRDAVSCVIYEARCLSNETVDYSETIPQIGFCDQAARQCWLSCETAPISCYQNCMVGYGCRP